MSTKLEQRRISAARVTRGISSDKIYRPLLNWLTDLNAAGYVLDFGAGSGTLTRLLLESGEFEYVEAIDIMQRPKDVPNDIKWHVADLNESTTLPDSSFDLIVSAEVIEHLENPRATAREWHRLLRPGGLVVFTTPNNQSLRSLIALMVRGHFVAFGDFSYPAHITALLSKDIDRIMLEAGFEKPSFRYTNAGKIPGWRDLTWQRISKRFRGSWVSDNILCAARKLSVQ